METETIVAGITARLTRLENSNRRLRVALGAVVVAAASLALGAAGRQESRLQVEEVVARRLRIVDETGRTYIEASAEGRGSRLKMFKGEEPAVWLSASCRPESGAALLLGSQDHTCGADSTSMVELLASSVAAQCGVTTTSGSGSAASAGFEATTEGTAVLDVLAIGDGSGEIRLACDVERGSTAKFKQSGDDRVTIGSSTLVRTPAGAVESRPTPRVQLFSSDGSIIEWLPRERAGK